VPKILARDLAQRAIDVALAVSFLILLSPVLLIIGLAIVFTSPGPVLFCQQRLGLNAKPFKLLKFRTMFAGAAEIRAEDGSTIVLENDSRVTRVGRFLRKTSLDELPQLLNVIWGDMSLVGPRPDQMDQLRLYSAREYKKLLVRPGITGLAQISGRNQITWEERKSLDTKYIEMRSLVLYVHILLRTVPYVLLQKDMSAPRDDNSSNANQDS
jgi:undecaprenyl phosphate N,N'-diacetylbacillosamine 1-phosphate transferase